MMIVQGEKLIYIMKRKEDTDDECIFHVLT